MPLPLTVDKLDAVPESARGAYVERDGKFHLDAEVEDVAPLKTKNAELLGETKKEREQRKKLEKELADLKAEADAKAHGLTTEKLAEIKAQAEARFKGDLEERDRLKAENRALKLDTTIKGKLAGKVFDADAAWRLIGSDFDLTEDGKAIVKADPTADVDKYLETKVKAQYPFLFVGTQADGGGAGGHRGGGAPATAKTPTQMTTAEITAFVEQHGREAYMELLQKEQLAILTKKKAA